MLKAFVLTRELHDFQLDIKDDAYYLEISKLANILEKLTKNKNPTLKQCFLMVVVCIERGLVCIDEEEKLFFPRQKNGAFYFEPEEILEVAKRFEKEQGGKNGSQSSN